MKLLVRMKIKEIKKFNQKSIQNLKKISSKHAIFIVDGVPK